ncbi:cyclopropane fatty acyl phospholipid synthase [Candidatus Parcubacteria bacterium]|nr:cyclopropane fatty acyl phospholipid synthase [Candidatus Parcubacteria bacterium]
MKTDKLKNISQELLSLASVKINGSSAWDIKVNNENFHKRIFSQGSLGLGESYMDEWWDCERMDEFFYRALRCGLEGKIKRNLPLFFRVLWARIINSQSKSKAFNIGEKHYDIDNDLYKNMLGKRMAYTCGYWKNANNLDEAQESKLDLTCRKIGLKPGMKVLDIGCGWGSFAKYAAEKYKAEVVGITVSKKQVELGRDLCEGLPVEIRLQDYREVNEKFDRIISLGMFEHVGRKNYRKYMKAVCRCLKGDGLFLLHTIGGNKSVSIIDPWMNKYIFPGAMVPSIKQIAKAIEGVFVMEDWHNFSVDYDKTLMAWHDNFCANWDKIKKDYNNRFYRMWRYYLLSCAGSFRARKNQLWQIVLSKKGVIGGYNSIR